MRTFVISMMMTMMLTGAVVAYDVVDDSQPNADEQALLQAVADETRDPVSVQFRKVRASEHPNGGICGEINGKNGFGGYVGFRPFYKRADDDGAIILPDRGDITHDLAQMTLQFTGCV